MVSVSAMKCITARTSLSIHHNHHYHHQLDGYSNCQRPRLLRCPQRQECERVNTQTTTRAVLSTTASILADVMQPKGDINVFLQTGGLMFSAYLLTNFVVPSIVSKQLQQLDESAANEPDIKSVVEEKRNEQPKKKGVFNSTKP